MEKKSTLRPKKSISNEYEKAASTASYYGFSLAPELSIEKEDLSKAKNFKDSHSKEIHPFKDEESKFSGYLEEKISLVRSYFDKKFSHLAQPIMLYYEGPMENNPHIKKTKAEKTFNLEIIGNGKSIADAIIIETAYVILKEHYPGQELCININSIGDKDSIGRFIKELTNYYKKNWSDVPAHCKAVFKKDIFELFTCKDEKCLELQEGAPMPMSFLGEASRSHFKEVLEYLESLNIPYNINHRLIGSRSYCSGTIFEIRSTDEKGACHTICLGERYNSLSKRVFGKKELPAIGASLLIHPEHLKKISKKKNPSLDKAKFYFIQLGFDAKLKSLKIIEILRQAKIPVLQSLSKDKLSGQILAAEKLEIPYILILGQKEAMDESVTVRSMATRAQQTVKIDNLVEYLKKLK